MKNITVPLLSPVFMSYEDMKKAYDESSLVIKKDFYEEYSKRASEMHHIADHAKIFIFENYEKIKDWSKIDLYVMSKNGEIHFNSQERKIPEKDDPRYEYKLKIHEIFKENHNPMISLTDVIIDPSDRDFSVTINNEEFLFLTDEEVIIIADYIENQLKEQN